MPSPTQPARTIPATALAATLLAAATAPAPAQQPQEQPQQGQPQQGPRQLFPARPPVAVPRELPAPARSGPGDLPLSLPVGPAPDRPSIQVESLAPPTLAALGSAVAERALGGPLWTRGAGDEVAALIARLPDEVAEPSLRQMQRDLLLAPGPSSGGSPGLLEARVMKLLTMAEPAAALELIGLVPSGSGEPGLERLRPRVQLAADDTVTPCATGEAAAPGAAAAAAEVEVVCAALAADRARVELELGLLGERGRAASPILGELARSLAADERLAILEPIPADPLLLPLLRRVGLDIDPELAARQPPAVRRALQDNPRLGATIRATAAPAPRPAPSLRPEFQGQPPVDWDEAMAGLGGGVLERYLALAEGLGLAPPPSAWRTLLDRTQGATAAAGTAPPLAYWRVLEAAQVADDRGRVLLAALLLLDGRPEAAPAVALDRSLQALRGLRLDDAARVLAAGTAGALGL
jgi:hypothetical protein